MEALRSIVYVSSATLPLTGLALETLLLGARDFNLRHAITGVLICNDGSFMQCFEGPPDAVGATWNRIRRSRSHTGILELLDEPVSFRSFPSWGMACAQATESDLLRLSTKDWSRTAGQDGTLASAGLELLRQFWRDAQQG